MRTPGVRKIVGPAFSHLDTDSRCLIVTKMSYKVIIINNKSNQLSIMRALTGT